MISISESTYSHIPGGATRRFVGIWRAMQDRDDQDEYVIGLFPPDSKFIVNVGGKKYIYPLHKFVHRWTCSCASLSSAAPVDRSFRSMILNEGKALYEYFYTRDSTLVLGALLDVTGIPESAMSNPIAYGRRLEHADQLHDGDCLLKSWNSPDAKLWSSRNRFHSWLFETTSRGIQLISPGIYFDAPILQDVTAHRTIGAIALMQLGLKSLRIVWKFIQSQDVLNVVH
ncbi:hypothetical protein EDD85DRAFT_1007666 [Armillaria nabsnona]|nr:hypothetical protein EDD85DRAFT_1007666 [Armillaria nabsnona]